jgi:hypothetical protein
MSKLQVLECKVRTKTINQSDYISLTDIAKYKDERTDYLISNWMRNRNTIEFLGLWEKLNNNNFNPIEFDGIKTKAGLNSFVLTINQWIDSTSAIGIISKPGRYGGTYAHKDIAFEFATWISVEFKLYLIKDYERLKGEEQKQLGWNLKRLLSKINYNIHTDAIKNNLIPDIVTKEQINMIYANEADIINVALFGMTAKEWKTHNKKKKGNMRDYANIVELICLVNLENLNSVYINEGLGQRERIIMLNKIAIHQMNLLTNDNRIEKLNIVVDEKLNLIHQK